jgi:dihydroxy-acid dehydratase
MVWSALQQEECLRAVGFKDEDFAKPQIGVASSWNEITPCNLSLDRLAKASKKGVIEAGGFPMQFGTISVSDGISMGHEGMHFSLGIKRGHCRLC